MTNKLGYQGGAVNITAPLQLNVKFPIIIFKILKVAHRLFNLSS